MFKNNWVPILLALGIVSVSLELLGGNTLYAQEPTAAMKKAQQQYVAGPAKDKSAPDGNIATRGGTVADALIASQARGGYRVGVDDELMISVWHEPELSQAVVVRPDGMITLPLLNDVKVVGLTTEQLQAALTEKLRSVVNEPQVTVVVKAIKSQRVFLMGAVVKQGVFPLGGSMTVLQLIAQGGGLGPFAKTRSIYILRRESDKDIRIPVNYKKALSGKGDDPLLQSGDMVVVP